MARRKRAPCCDSSQVNRGPWSDEESEILKSYILQNGHANWRALPELAGLRRCGKSCRLRWINYLRPGLKRGNFTKEEEDTIIQLHNTLGNKWSRIASHFPGRTDNEIKNVWNTNLKKRLLKESNSSSTEVMNHQASSASSSSFSSSNDVINSEKKPLGEELEEMLEADMACGFQVDAPQSLEFLFEEKPLIPPQQESLAIQTPLPMSQPESLAIQTPLPMSQPESLAIQTPLLMSQPEPLPIQTPPAPQLEPLPVQTAENDYWSRMLLEPGFDDYNEWLEFLR